MNFSANSIQLSGEYKLVITKPNGMTIETDWIKNIITDIGLDRIGESLLVASHCRVGTGTSTPLATNTQLDAQVASTGTIAGSTSSRAGSPTYAYTYTLQYRFPQGSFSANTNLTEMGIGWSSSGATLFSRALILDSGGNPTSITLQPIDQLDVYYRGTQYPPVTDVNGSFVITENSVPVTYNYTGRVSLVANQWGSPILFSSQYNDTGIYKVYSSAAYWSAGGTGSALGAITSTPSGATYDSINVTNITYSSYVVGSFYRDATLVIPVTMWNRTGGIKTMGLQFSIGTSYQYQYEITPLIPKTNTKTLTITFRSSWGRYTP